ncbi:hypothetical protein WJX72_003823 [[Myrmecia] bisecta]|uniref:ShKT domain-containing protein n=1 Tax=[Myrmecia] bisecta TaxID=41462 RepID=A0AAW1QER2_9CHLO
MSYRKPAVALKPAGRSKRQLLADLTENFAPHQSPVTVACSLFIGLCCCLPLSHGAPTVHTVVPTECGLYFTWQTLGIFYSHRKSGQAGPITRIMSCTEEQLKQYNDVDLVPTHVAPSLTQDPAHNDVYSAYNKPGAVKHWIENTDPPEDFILVIDADMIMRTPFFPDQLGAGPGWAISAFFSYMKGVNNELAEKHIPWVARRNDTIAGPYGRKGDMVGGFCLMDKNDLRRVAPLWLKYSMDVRNDPDAWNLTGDHYSIHPGDKPWISEMYGYSYGTAHAGVWHKVDYSAMIYPGDYTPSSPPKVIHYGLLYSVANTDYQYDKHWHYGFDARRCPPWGDLTQRQPRGGLFPHPPHPESLKTQGFELMRDLMAVETIITLNAAFCEHHRAHCPPSEELERECGKVADMEDALTRMFAQLAPVLANECSDRDSRCQMWADGGECLSNPGYMLKSCEKACGHCYNAAPVTTTPTAAVKLRGKGGGKRTLPDATVAAATDADGVKVEVVNPGTLPTARPGQQGAQQQQAAEIAHRDNPDVHDHSELHADQGLLQAGAVVIRGADLAAMKLARNLDDVKPILPEQQVSELVAGLKDKAASTLGEVLTADSYADSMPQEVTAITSRGFDQRVLPRDDLLPRAKPRPPKSTGGKPGGVAGLLSHLGWIGLGLWVFSIVAFLALLPRARRRVQRRTKSRRSL